jgi:hypothetical protein
MDQRVIMAAALGVFLACAQNGHAATHMMTGNELLRTCQDQISLNYALCLGYIEGANDLGEIWRDVDNKPECLHSGVEARQFQEIVVNYLLAHPEQRDWSAAALVYNAVRGAWGCK